MNSGERVDSPPQPPPLPPPAVPSVVVGPTPAPWSLRATVGWGSLIAFAVLMIQGAILFGGGRAMVAMNFIPEFDPDALARNGLMLSIVTLASAVVGITLCFLIAWMRRGYPIADYLGISLPKPRVVLRWVGALLVFAAASDLLTALLGRSIIPDFMIEAMRTAVIPPLLWMAVIVAAPLSEEFFFRGFLIKGMQHSRLGPVGAILITSALWAAIHLQYQFYQMAWIFAAGLLLGTARVRTNSVILCVLLHALMNLIATVETAIYMATRT